MKKKGEALRGKQAVKQNLENTLQYYNADNAKKLVGQLFDDYIKEEGKSYYKALRDDDEQYEKTYEEPYEEPYEETYEEYDESYEEEYDEPYNEEYSEEEDYGASYERKSYYVGDYDDDYYEGYSKGYEQADNFDEDDYYDIRNPKRPYTDEDMESLKTEYTYDDVYLYSPRRRTRKNVQKKKKQKLSDISSKTNEKPKKKVPRKNSGDGFMTNEDYDYVKKTKGSALKIFVVILVMASLGFSAMFLYKINELQAEIEVYKAEINTYKEQIESFKHTEQLVLGKNEKKDTSYYKESGKELSSEPISEEETETNTERETETEEDFSGITEYTVKKGDTLWKISEKIFGDGKYYIDIMEANDIKDNRTLYTGEVLIIPKI